MDDRPADEASGDLVEVARPAPAHTRESYESTIRDDHDSEDEREATELIPVVHDDSTLAARSHVLNSDNLQDRWYSPIRKYWRHHIRISVPHDDCRDHLANERTFLGYLRTSVMLSVVGTLIAQLYRLHHTPDPSKVFGYFILGRPLSAIFQCAALCTILLGFIRFWRQQSAMAIGKVHAGGWEITTMMVGSFALLLMMLAVHIGVEAYESVHPKE